MGNGFYDVLMMKMKFNFKSNLTVSFMETKTIVKESIKLKDNSTCLHSDSFGINIGKSQDN